jgi:hypothetical protein
MIQRIHTYQKDQSALKVVPLPYLVSNGSRASG